MSKIQCCYPCRAPWPMCADCRARAAGLPLPRKPKSHRERVRQERERVQRERAAVELFELLCEAVAEQVKLPPRQ